MKPILFVMALALFSSSAESLACDARKEVSVDLREEAAKRIFEELAESEGLTIANVDALDGARLTGNFKSCSMREAIDRLASSIGLAIVVQGSTLRLVSPASPRR
jgi:hypothetical protein